MTEQRLTDRQAFRAFLDATAHYHMLWIHGTTEQLDEQAQIAEDAFLEIMNRYFRAEGEARANAALEAAQELHLALFEKQRKPKRHWWRKV